MNENPEHQEIVSFPTPQELEVVKEYVPSVHLDGLDADVLMKAAKISGSEGAWKLLAPAVGVALVKADPNQNHEIRFGVKKPSIKFPDALESVYRVRLYRELDRFGSLGVNATPVEGGSSYIDSLSPEWIYASTEEELRGRIQLFQQQEGELEEQYGSVPGDKLLVNEFGGLDVTDIEATIDSLTRRFLLAHEILKIDRSKPEDLVQNGVLQEELFDLFKDEWKALWNSFCNASETAREAEEESSFVDERGELMGLLQSLTEVKISSFIQKNAKTIEDYRVVANNPQVAVKFFQISKDPKLKALTDVLGESFGKRY